MKRFGYGRDALALTAMVLYALNRWVVKPHAHAGFLHDHFNDMLLIPAALPLILWVQRRLGWRAHDAAPTAGEIALHLGIWTAICEGVGPHFVAHATADWRDGVAYLAGALAAGLWWRWREAVSGARSRAVTPA